MNTKFIRTVFSYGVSACIDGMRWEEAERQGRGLISNIKLIDGSPDLAPDETFLAAYETGYRMIDEGFTIEEAGGKFDNVIKCFDEHGPGGPGTDFIREFCKAFKNQSMARI